MVNKTNGSNEPVIDADQNQAANPVRNNLVLRVSPTFSVIIA